MLEGMYGSSKVTNLIVIGRWLDDQIMTAWLANRVHWLDKGIKW
jgi:hypothetical protein